MRHTNIEHCPVTNTPNIGGFTWTDHDKAGCYNSCPQCCPNDAQSVGEALYKLNKQREQEIRQ